MDLNQARELAVKLRTSGKEPQAIVDALNSKGFTFKKGAPITTKTLGPLFRQHNKPAASATAAIATSGAVKPVRRMNQATAASTKSVKTTANFDSSIVKSVLQNTQLSAEHRVEIALKFL
jgi:hypothetical protein